MTSNKRYFSLRIAPETYEKIRALAYDHRNSIAREMEIALEAYIQQQEALLCSAIDLQKQQFAVKTSDQATSHYPAAARKQMEKRLTSKEVHSLHEALLDKYDE